jgi:soluble lytic murein transglycosylase-like protein
MRKIRPIATARRSALWTVSLALAFFPLAVRAGELVTLRNGMEMHCTHHLELDGRTRIFLSADEASYIELTPAEISEITKTADPIAAALPSTAAAAGPPRNAELTTTDLREMLGKAGVEHNLDVDLLASIVKAESSGNPRAVSRAGARGLMQLMPSTASQLGVSDSFKAEQNVNGGSTYLDALLVRYHDNLALALAAYNAGPAAVDRYRGIPPFHETRAYVARVIHEFNRRVMAREALSSARGRTASPSH